MRRPGKGGAGDRGSLKDGKKGREAQEEGLKVEKTLKKRRVDDFHTGFVGKLRPPGCLRLKSLTVQPDLTLPPAQIS